MNLELIRKYSVSGPRYTSYPTAPHFQENFPASGILRAAEDFGKSNKDISLYFHLPYCDTLCYFCACSMIRSNNRERISRYLDYLKKEIRLYSPLFKDKKVTQMHWGGGTPSHLMPEEILELGAEISQWFSVSPDAEISVEIDPRGLTPDHLDAFREIGMNRVSMGIQDFQEKVQKAVNRIHSYEMIQELVDQIRNRGFHGINLDLMYGLPYQSRESFRETVHKILSLHPDRIALFHFAHLPDLKKHQRLIPVDALPHPEEKILIFQDSHDALRKAGYEYIGMDHFAITTDELAIASRNNQMTRNFQGYSTRKNTDILAMGITAISQMASIYYQNYKTEAEYFSALDAGIFPVYRGFSLSPEDILRRDVIMTLMCDRRLDFAHMGERHRITFRDYFEKEIHSLSGFEREGLVQINPDSIEITEEGKFVIRNIAMVFDSYIRTNKNITYSKTV